MPAQYSKVSRICPVCRGHFSSTEMRIATGRGKYCSRACKDLALRVPAAERFWSKVDKDGPICRALGPCWLWLAALWGTTRYGKFGPDHGASILAHRYSWELAYGAIPEGMKVLHKCDNPQCVNPAHLFLGTTADNAADMIRKGRNRTGERHHAAKLSREAVEAIREAAGSGVPQVDLARQHGVSEATISSIVLRHTWAKVA